MNRADKRKRNIFNSYEKDLKNQVENNKERECVDEYIKYSKRKSTIFTPLRNNNFSKTKL